MPRMREILARQSSRVAIYIFVLLAINIYFVKKLFFLEFTDNMQTNAGSFMAISRFILQHWPHLDWFPWWFNGEPFENSYTPMLHLIDAAFAGVFHCSPARAFNFVTAAFYVLGPVSLFVFAWRVSRFIETSFLAALAYSLFSPAALFQTFRADLDHSVWNPWRLRVLVHYGEGPHVAEMTVLPLALLLLYLAITNRRFLWIALATATAAFATLINAFGAVDLAVGGICLVLCLRGRREIIESALLLALIGIGAYMWASPFLTPTLVRTLSANSQVVEGDYHTARLLPMQCLIVAAFLGLWFLTRRAEPFLLRFSVLFGFVFFAITAMYAIAGRPALPQPNRYSVEMEMGLALAIPFLLRSYYLRAPSAVKLASIAVVLVLAAHQTVEYRRYAKSIIRSVDITSTIEYKIAQAMNANVGTERALVSAQAGTWLNLFSDTPQMDGGHGPFNPNFHSQQSAMYAIYSSENAGSRDAEVSILWLKAFGCHAVHVSGPNSRVDGKPFRNPAKFNGVLPVIWREEDDTIYAVPQRTRSLAHVIPETAVVQHGPIHGLDTAEAARYVAALDDPRFPPAPLTWRTPAEAHIESAIHPGQLVSVQVTYDKGWRASSGGHAVPITRDGLGLIVLHPNCDGPCAIDLKFEGGTERELCRSASRAVTLWVFIVVASRRRRSHPR